MIFTMQAQILYQYIMKIITILTGIVNWDKDPE